MWTDDRFGVRVTSTAYEGERIVSFTLERVEDVPLPAWEAGAHIDVRLPSGTVRQYSLCGDPRDRSHYRIAVLELPNGRGGSVEVHRELRAGCVASIGTPRQDFPLIDAPSYTLVAGGIGITPIVSMAYELARTGADWRVVYCTRSRERMAFVDELAALQPRYLTLLDEATDGRIDPDRVMKEAGDGAIYCCGPSGMLDAFADTAKTAGRADSLHTERFGTTPLLPTDEGEIAVDLVRSGISLVVPAGRSILEAVRDTGVTVPSSCEQGICGTCETRILGGTPDHRDQLLTDEERTAGQTMMLCVSRALRGQLSLDL